MYPGRALAYKDDGNILFKEKKYKEAITAYSEGLKQGSTDNQLLAILHCNRAAAHYHIGNYCIILYYGYYVLIVCVIGNMRSSITDAKQAKTIKPDHIKAFIRGIYITIKKQATHPIYLMHA